MSREFGTYGNGYFDTQIEYAAEDCEGGSDALTREWGKVLRAFYPVAYAIASSEACDSTAEHPIRETIKHLPTIKAALADVEQHVKIYERVAAEAIRRHIKEHENV